MRECPAISVAMWPPELTKTSLRLKKLRCRCLCKLSMNRKLQAGRRYRLIAREDRNGHQWQMADVWSHFACRKLNGMTRISVVV